MTHVSMSALVAGARAGQLVSFPTDTIPALAVRPDRAELLFAAKRRSLQKPLILMGAFAQSLWPYVKGSEAEFEVWQHVAQQCWPGALTLVLPASDRVPVAMNPHNPTTLGVRVPDSKVAIAILSQTGPLATTSANLSGKSPLQTMAEIEEQFPEVLTLNPTEIAMSQPTSSGLPSTVAKWTGEGWELLRLGGVQLEGKDPKGLT